MEANGSLEERADFYYNKAARLDSSDRKKEAVVQLQLCLEIEPHHGEAGLLLGEIHLFHVEELRLSTEDGDTIAIGAFEDLLKENPQKTEAWAGLALALLYQDNYAGAIEAANKGFEVIGLDTSWVMMCPDVFMNVAESLYDVKIRAYLGKNKKEDAKAQLKEGLTFCPDSEFLARHLDKEQF